MTYEREELGRLTREVKRLRLERELLDRCAFADRGNSATLL